MTSPFSKISKKYLGVICLIIIAVILIAGLWPRIFNTLNDVAFLPYGNGIHFSSRGIIYNKKALVKRHTESNPGSFSIELALQADKEWSNYLPRIAAFVDDGKPCERLIVGQWKSHLIIRHHDKGSCRADRTTEIGLMNVLSKGKSQFISITSGIHGTSFYIDGKLKVWRKESSLLNPDEMLSGHLVLGNSAYGKYPWIGTLYALAIYDQVLTSEEAVRHYESWRDNGSLSIETGRLPIALYLFNERTGPIVRDQSGIGNDLIIPEHFTPLRRRMLVMPWDDFHADRRYAIDVVINILGFIPFGFFISWYLSERGIARPLIIIIAMVLGIGISLFIEIIQAYLPARSSQIMDVLSNGGGTVLGIYLWRRYISPLRHATINYRRNNQ